MRGKHRGGHLVGFLAGLIPAYAGKTATIEGGGGVRGAHPRVCGENESSEGESWYAQGSSPRMRGKQARRPRAVQARGLIPAYAGKTVSLILAVISKPAHPRVCGENPTWSAL